MAQGAATLHAEAWQRLALTIAAAQRTDVLKGLATQLHCSDEAIEHTAARAWMQWEQDLMDLEAQIRQAPALQRLSDDGAVLAMARIGAHFARRGFFLGVTQLLTQSARLAAVPGVIVQRERDLVTPPASAQALHRAWPGSLLRLVTGAGHAFCHPAIAQALVAATVFFGAPPTTR